MALLRETGEEQWSVEPPNGRWHSHSDTGDGHIYAGTTTGNLVSISTRNGTVDWNVTVSEGDRILPYTSTDGFVLASDYERGTLHVFDACTGESQWAIASKGNMPVFPGAIGGETVYYPSGTTLQAYAVGDKRLRWRADMGGNEYRRIRLIGETLYVGTHERLQAYATADGTLRWRFSTDDDHYHFPKGTTRNSLIVHSRKGGGKKEDETTYALSLDDGHVRWRYNHELRTAGDHQIAGERVYFSGEDGTVRAIGDPGRSRLYDTLRRIVSPTGLAAGGVLGAALLGGYRLYRTDDGEESESATEPERPTWNGYELRERLDDETHLARTGDGDTVLLRRFTDPPETFEEDATKWAKLDFDGVQRVHDWGTDPEPWIAVKHVEGPTAVEIAASLDEETAVGIVARTAEILHLAHKRGVFHESLSAENVMVTDSGVTVANWRFTGTGGGSEERVAADVRRLGELGRSLCPGEPSESVLEVLERATDSDPEARYGTALEFADMHPWSVRNG